MLVTGQKRKLWEAVAGSSYVQYVDLFFQILKYIYVLRYNVRMIFLSSCLAEPKECKVGIFLFTFPEFSCLTLCVSKQVKTQIIRMKVLNQDNLEYLI